MLCVLRCSHIIKYYFIIITMYDFYCVSGRKKKIGLLYAPSCSYHMLPAWQWEPERSLFLPQNYLLLTERWRHSNPLQYSSLENPMDGEAWWATFHAVAKSRTRLSDFTFTFHFHAWRRKWQPTPVFSLVGCRLWGHTKSDMTEVTWQQMIYI